MQVNPQVTITFSPDEYTQLLMLVDYIINDDSVMTEAMYAFAVTFAGKVGLQISNSEDTEEEQDTIH